MTHPTPLTPQELQRIPASDLNFLSAEGKRLFWERLMVTKPCAETDKMEEVLLKYIKP